MKQSTSNRTNRVLTLYFCDIFDKVILYIGRVAYWFNAILLLVIALQVILRYVLNSNYVVLEELQWHLYAFAVMIGISYVQVQDRHVRVDIFRMRYSLRTNAVIEIIGILFFLLPFIIIVFIHSLDFVLDSWRVNENSIAPKGLPWRWIIKSVIPVSFGLVGITALTRLLREVIFLTSRKQSEKWN